MTEEYKIITIVLSDYNSERRQMKKNILNTFVLLTLISLTMPTSAQIRIPDKFDARQIQTLYDENQAYFKSADYMLDSLLNIPYEKRQYYIPMIHELRIVPHKVTSHPQIIIWKNKKPTVIAPQLKEYAEKYLDKLPASFYPFLDPDEWKQPETQKIRDVIGNVNYDDIGILSSEETKPNPDYKAKTLEEAFPISEETKKSYTQTIFKQGEIERYIDTLNDLPDFIYQKDIELASQLRDFIKGDNITTVMAWPFREWVNFINQTDQAEAFSQFIRNHGWKNTMEFAEKADIVLKATRVNKMLLTDAIALHGLRKQYPIRPNEKLLPIQMIAEMYNAKAGDVLFVEKYVNELEKIYNDDIFIHFGMPISLD